MGLVHQAIVAQFAGGWKCNINSPLSFITNPILLVDLMSQLRVTWAVAPDFEYRLLARKFKATARCAKNNSEHLIPMIDLSSFFLCKVQLTQFKKMHIKTLTLS